jgi:hypothetical protein
MPVKAPIPKSEEDLVVEYIYTTYLIQLLETDYHTAGSLNFKIPEAYQSLIENKLKALRKQLVEIKEKMRVLKIKVADPYHVHEDFVEYPYFAHGAEGRMRFWTAAMAYEGTRRLKQLFKVGF